MKSSLVTGGSKSTSQLVQALLGHGSLFDRSIHRKASAASLQGLHLFKANGSLAFWLWHGLPVQPPLPYPPHACLTTWQSFRHLPARQKTNMSQSSGVEQNTMSAFLGCYDLE